MNEDVSFLLKHRRNGALIDANLLLVYVVGKTDKSWLSRLQHTKQYEQDFPLIEATIEFFPRIYTTPNILTETSNLGKKVGEQFFRTLGRVISVLDERYCVSREAAADRHFCKLGLTDAGLLAIADQMLVVTTDFTLFRMLRAQNLDAVNFNHLRPFGWAGMKLFLA
ncbi:MAG: hypothetical protein H7039_22630 [Bryobacteraceae bacterium]|nr:hypothetical protein [Bryobacteraceae bacterium]